MKNGFSQQINSGFMVSEGRNAKALKILKVISEANPPITANGNRLKLLDIGTGSGEIAYILSEKYNVTSVDVIDQRLVSEGFSFQIVEAENLPFPDQTFDIVVSNHIIEHVTNADKHISEIGRVINNDGLVYLATPNRLWPWEVHYHIPMLHYLPAELFIWLMKLLNRYHEDVRLMSFNCLKQKAMQTFTLTSVSDRICKWPQQYYMDCPTNIAKFLSLIPLWFYRISVFIHPTLIVILRKKS